MANSAIEANGILQLLFFKYFSQRTCGRRKTRGGGGVALVALGAEVLMMTS